MSTAVQIDIVFTAPSSKPRIVTVPVRCYISVPLQWDENIFWTPQQFAQWAMHNWENATSHIHEVAAWLRQLNNPAWADEVEQRANMHPYLALDWLIRQLLPDLPSASLKVEPTQLKFNPRTLKGELYIRNEGFGAMNVRGPN